MPNEYCVLLLQTLACRHAASVKGVELYMERKQMLMLAN